MRNFVTRHGRIYANVTRRNMNAIIDTTVGDGPEWIRPGDLPIRFGIGRTKGYELMAQGKIESVSIRKPGAKHGTRLIKVASIRAYLNSLPSDLKAPEIEHIEVEARV